MHFVKEPLAALFLSAQPASNSGLACRQQIRMQAQVAVSRTEGWLRTEQPCKLCVPSTVHLQGTGACPAGPGLLPSTG